MSDKENVEQKESQVPTKKLQDEDLKEAKESLSRTERLRSDSGNIEFTDTLTTFLYLLLRDHVPAGKVEMAVRESVLGPETITFTNGFLAQYADNLANTLKNAKVRTLQDALTSVFSDGIPTKQEVERGKLPSSLDDPDLLTNLQEKVDAAVDGMSDEEREKFDSRVTAAKEDVAAQEEEDVAAQEQEDVAAQEEEELETNDQDEYRANIANSLSALEKITKIVPSDTVKQVAEILKNEVESELSDEAKEDIQTRESILEARAEENKEHQATNEHARQTAEEYIKEQVEDALISKEVDSETENTVSRGNLKDVVEGRAFPDALDKVFGDDDPQAELEKAKELDKVMDDIRTGKQVGVFHRVE
jgi:hypothetical protein